VAKLKYTFTNGTLFKMLFAKYPDLLKKLVAVLLEISLESIGEFLITNPEMPPDIIGDKFCQLGINMTVNGQRVDLEVQVSGEGDNPERSLYYWAREYSSALPLGSDYSDLPRVVIVNIVDYRLFDSEEYHSEYLMLGKTRHTPLTEKLRLHYFELPKLSKNVAALTDQERWLALFNAKTEEDLARIEALEAPEITQAIKAYRDVAATDIFLEAERLRSLARSSEAAALRHARKLESEKWQGIVAGKDAALADKDAAIAKQAALIAELQAELDARNAYRDVTATDIFLEAERLRSLARSNEASALRHARELESEKWQSIVAGKDSALAGKDAALADKDAALADKDAALAAAIAEQAALIAELRAQLDARNQ
jgi:predicted transposase/invertase (TIGR01784 family)